MMSLFKNIDPSGNTILVTGCAGFIGFYLADTLLAQGFEVVGLDNVNDYYDVFLKRSRLEQLKKRDGFVFYEADLADNASIEKIFQAHSFCTVVNLAAQAGVRYSLENPRAYIDANVVGFFNILDGCRNYNVPHLVYASSSSVYGLNRRMPFNVSDNVDHPVSLYAASKKSNELMAHSYSHLYQLPTTGLRFFTVYGPWGRPDMAYFKFCRAIALGEPLHLFNHGNMQRDFTYIDDIIHGICGVIDSPPTANEAWDGMNPDPASAPSPYRVFNIGRGKPVQLKYFLELIEKEMGEKADVRLEPMQPGDVEATYADVDALVKYTGVEPEVSVEEGIHRFVEWFRTFYLETGRTISR